MGFLEQYTKELNSKKQEKYSLNEYLKKAKKDKSMYYSAPERLLLAIGKPTIVDTSKDVRLSRIHGNRLITTYDRFKDFYGMESTIADIVSYLKHSAQGLEESKQILYLLGPVGSAKSSLAEKLKELMEEHPIYILGYGDEDSPINESPLGLFPESAAEGLGIPKRYLKYKMSPWAAKHLRNNNNNLSSFYVKKVYPSQLEQLAIAKTEPGDENNQDISSLVGKLNIRKLETLNQDDPFAYNFSGGLGLGNRGVLEFVEMFKAPIKMLHPLLTATQESNYIGTEQIGAIPFDGIVLAHSNETEWDSFKNDSKNEAFIDRICIIRVPYNLRVQDEVRVYRKLLRNSDLVDAPCTPHTMEMLAQFCVASRLVEPENSNVWTKLKVYDGDSMKDKDPNAKSLQEYRDAAGILEGMSGVSTRFAFKVLSKVFNFNAQELGANPVHLMFVLEDAIRKEQLQASTEESYLAFIKEYSSKYFAQKLEKDVHTAYLDSAGEYGQAIFDKYVMYADHWCEDRDYRDSDTGQMYDRKNLDKELSVIEKSAGISNPKDFRHEVVHYCLRYKASHSGSNPAWTAYAKLRKVIEAHMFGKIEDVLPIVSFDGAGTKEGKRKHTSFISKMKSMGYTERQVRLCYDWLQRYKANN